MIYNSANKNRLSYLWIYGNSKKIISIAFVLNFASGLFETTILYYLGGLLNTMQEVNRIYLSEMVILALIYFLGRSVLLACTSYFNLVVVRPLSYKNIAENFFQFLFYQEPEAYKDASYGSITSRLQEGIRSAADLALEIGNTIAFAIGSILPVIFLIDSDAILALPLLIMWLLLYISVIISSSTSIRESAKNRDDEQSYLFSSVREGLTGLATLRSFNVIDGYLKLISGRLQAVHLRMMDIGQTSALYRAKLIVIGSALPVILGFISYLSMKNYESFLIGEFVANISIGLRLAQMTVWVGYALSFMAIYSGSINSLIDALRAFPAPESAATEVAPARSELRRVELRGVSFRYSRQMNGICDVSFCCKRGNITALIGRSGTGKSTIAKLLSGRLTPQAGQIMFHSDNHRPPTITWLEQESVIFSGTVRYNIVLGRPCSESALMNAIELSGLSEFLQEIEDDIGNRGLDAVLKEGGPDLSGGQKKILCLARAYARPSDLLILDETFSGIDEITTVKLLKGLRKLDCAILVITHSPTIAKSADKLLLLRYNKVEVVDRTEALGSILNYL